MEEQNNPVSIHKYKVIDNQTITMTEALTQLLPLGSSLSMAVGYFFLSGYNLIQDALNKIANYGGVRLIIGNRTDLKTAHEINEGICVYENNQESCSDEILYPLQALETEFISIEPASNQAYVAYRLRDLIAQGKISVKIYTGSADYFHSKVYLISREDHLDGYAIVGSSNFSRGGFTGNSELNVMTKDAFSNLMIWFDELWDSPDVSDFNLDLINLIDNNVIRPNSYGSVWEEEQQEYELQGGPEIPPFIKLRDYQKNAITTWIEKLE